MPADPKATKKRIYEVAKDLGMSSEVIQQLAKKLGVEVKNHMSTLTTDVVDKVRAELGKEKAAAREEVVKQQEHEAQRARDERQRAHAAQQAQQQAAHAAQQAAAQQAAARAQAAAAAPSSSAAAPSAPSAPRPSTGPAQRPAGGGYGGQRPGGGSSAPRPGGYSGARPGGAPGAGRPASGGYGGPRPGGAPSGSRPGGGGYGGPRPGGGPGGPRPSGGPSGGPTGGRPTHGGFGAPGGGPRPSFGGPGGPGRGRRDRKKKKHVDEKLAAESVRKTLASLDTSQVKRKHRRREDGTEVPIEDAKIIRAPEFITVSELANMMQVKPQEVITACMRMGLMATINKRLDKDSIAAVADEFEFGVEFVSEFEEQIEDEVETIPAEKLRPRPAVVTVMGHVDHGKTSLLDYVRRTNVVAGESGGITQHIGAYEVTLPSGQHITFLDTPGHEAFTAMRARGAQVTDIVVLVVAADDRVMPQTIEAIDHAKAANVPIVVAINKIDLPTADGNRIRTELAGHGVVVEVFGGKYASVEISAKKGTGMEQLLEMILLTAELLELKADPDRRAKGVVLEARVEQGRGVVASVLVQSGTLRMGDPFVAGQVYGRVRAMYDERRRQVKEAPPSTPVEVVGWSGTPSAGDIFVSPEDEREAREVASKRAALHREHEQRSTKAITLTSFHDTLGKGGPNELKMLIKGDVDGSVEALSESLQKLSTGEVAVRVIRSAVGQITESDVLLAAASAAIIVGFHVRPDSRAREMAEREKVEIRLYDIIYKAQEDVKLALEGMLKPELKEVVLGSAEVRQVFKLSKGVVVAGCMVSTGKITRNEKIRVLRGDETVWTGRVEALKRFKDDVREVEKGFECGITLDGFHDLHEGDRLESFKIEELARTL
jgi:translation initiation factor IF-2